MYSMKRSVWPRSLKNAAIGTIWSSLTPRLITAFTFTGKPGGDRGVDSLEHAVDGEVDVVQRAERRVVERVEADGDALQAGIGERLRLRGEQRGVRRQRQVDVERRELLDEALEVAADERLAAGDPDLARAERDERARDAGDLLERQQLLAVEEAVVAAVHLLRHAVGAAEVAAVGDRDAQVAQRAAEGCRALHRRRR